MKKPLNKVALSIQRNRFNKITGFLLLSSAAMLLCVMVAMFIEIGCALIGSPMPLEQALNQALYELNGGWGYLPYCVLILLAIRLWMGHGFFKTAVRSSHSMTFSEFLQILCVFLFAQVLTSFFSQYIEQILNYWGLSSYLALEAASGQNSPMSVIIYASIGAPIVEELLFRGAILQRMLPCGKRFAIVFSSLLFGLFHGNIIQIPFAFLVGLILAYVAVEYSLWWSILLHFINNCIISQVLSHVPVVQSLIIGACAISALVILTTRASEIRSYHRKLSPMSREAVQGFWTAPLTIVFVILMLLNTAASIMPV